MSQIRNNNPDPVPVGNSRLPKTEPPAPEPAGAGSQTLSQYGPSYNANCADCGVTGIILYRCSDGKLRCREHAFQALKYPASEGWLVAWVSKLRAALPDKLAIRIEHVRGHRFNVIARNRRTDVPRRHGILIHDVEAQTPERIADYLVKCFEVSEQLEPFDIAEFCRRMGHSPDTRGGQE